MPGEPESRYRVEISGGKGAVVGDYATVFQLFSQSAPALSSLIRAPQFRALVDERTRGFVGRDFVFDRVDELVGGDEFDSGYVVIRGEPGIGKTAIAAMLVTRRAYVHHFNIAPENIRTARQFLENVCAQLIVRYELVHTALPPSAVEDAGFLSQLLVESADRARERDQLPVVIVVDALDEVEDGALPSSTNRLFLPRVLPKGVFFVLTTREESDYRLDVDNAADIWIHEDDPKNREDLGRYIDGFVDGNVGVMMKRITEWQVTREAFAREMATLAEGNFMYLVHVLPDIARGRLHAANVGTMSALPRGLKSYYQRHWREMKEANAERFTRVQRPVLCFLAISREPVTTTRLTQWTRLEPADVMSVIREWWEFLNEDPGDGSGSRYRLYHRSFADFLDEQENLRYYHDQIASSALAKIPGFLGI
jgi:AAA ATPase-like protein